METLVVGDLHLKQPFVLPRIDMLLAERPAIGRVVFLGDACDDWGARPFQAREALEQYADWAERRRTEGMRVDVLLGNHDFCYIRGRRGPGTIASLMRDIRPLLEDRLHAQLACTIGSHLCTHAGVTRAWAKRYLCDLGEQNAGAIAERLNAMLANPDCWSALDSCPPSRGGWELPGPLWADLRDLADDPLPGISQLVGHTPVETATAPWVWAPDSPHAHVWACDTMSLTSTGTPIGDGSLLLVNENDQVSPLTFPGNAQGFHTCVNEYLANNR